MPSDWRYALEPLPVDPDIKKLGRSMTAPKRIVAVERDRQASSLAEVSAKERTRRIMRGLRTRVTEPDSTAQDLGPDDDPSRRN